MLAYGGIGPLPAEPEILSQEEQEEKDFCVEQEKRKQDARQRVADREAATKMSGVFLAVGDYVYYVGTVGDRGKGFVQFDSPDVLNGAGCTFSLTGQEAHC